MNHSFKRPAVPPKFSLPTTSKGDEQSIANDIIQLPKPSTSKQQENTESHLVKQYLHQHNKTKEPPQMNVSRPPIAVDTDDLEELDYLATKSVFLFGFPAGERLDSLILGSSPFF